MWGEMVGEGACARKISSTSTLLKANPPVSARGKELLKQTTIYKKKKKEQEVVEVDLSDSSYSLCSSFKMSVTQKKRLC
jgi:hypothetical protein